MRQCKIHHQCLHLAPLALTVSSHAIESLTDSPKSTALASVAEIKCHLHHREARFQRIISLKYITLETDLERVLYRRDYWLHHPIHVYVRRQAVNNRKYRMLLRKQYRTVKQEYPPVHSVCRPQVLLISSPPLSGTIIPKREQSVSHMPNPHTHTSILYSVSKYVWMCVDRLSKRPSGRRKLVDKGFLHTSSHLALFKVYPGKHGLGNTPPC